MTRFYLDTEFNGMGGELISLALAHQNGIVSFYEAVQWDAETLPWVWNNVLPVLDAEPLSKSEFRRRLHAFLSDFKNESIEIIADWPDDFAYFCKALLTDVPGECFNCDRIVMRFVNVKTASAIPHNAFSDALALRQACENG